MFYNAAFPFNTIEDAEKRKRYYKGSIYYLDIKQSTLKININEKTKI